MAKAEIISDGWQVFLAWAGRGAEVILFMCMAFSLVQAFPSIHVPEPLTGAVLIIQMITLDVAGFGLSSLAKQVRRAGDEATAEKAATVGTILICIMIISFLSVVINNLFGKLNPSIGPVSLSSVMTGIDYIMILARVVMTVLYGRIIHSLRESQQDAQAQADETEANLKKDLSDAQSNQRKAQESTSKLSQQVADLEKQLQEARQSLLANSEEQEQIVRSLRAQLAETEHFLQQAKGQENNQQRINTQLAEQVKQLEEAQTSLLNGSEGQGVIIKNLQNQATQMTSQLQQKQRDIERLNTDLQSAKTTIDRLQNAERESAKLRQQVQTLTEDLQSANQQRADLTDKLERTKKKVADLQKTGEQHPRIQRQEATGDNITDLSKARQKSRMSHAEVLAFLDQHPDLTRAEVAAKLEISERKVYDAVAWRRDNLQGENAVSR